MKDFTLRELIEKLQEILDETKEEIKQLNLRAEELQKTIDKLKA